MLASHHGVPVSASPPLTDQARSQRQALITAFEQRFCPVEVRMSRLTQPIVRVKQAISVLPLMLVSRCLLAMCHVRIIDRRCP